MVGPILSHTLPDIFCDNEYSPNFLFRNNGDGTFTDVAAQAGEQEKTYAPDHHTHICPFQNHAGWSQPPLLWESLVRFGKDVKVGKSGEYLVRYSVGLRSALENHGFIY